MWKVTIGGPTEYATAWLTRAEENIVANPENNRYNLNIKFFPTIPAATLAPAGWSPVADQAEHFNAYPSSGMSGKLYTADDPDGSNWMIAPALTNVTFDNWDAGDLSAVPSYVIEPNRDYLEIPSYQCPWFAVTDNAHTIWSNKPFRVELAFYKPISDAAGNHKTIVSWGGRTSDNGFEVMISANGDVDISEVHANYKKRLIKRVRTDKNINVTDRIWFEVWPISSNGAAILVSNLFDDEVLLHSTYSNSVVPNDCAITVGRTYGGGCALRVIRPEFSTGAAAHQILSAWKRWPWADFAPTGHFVRLQPSGTDVTGTILTTTIDGYTYYGISIVMTTTDDWTNPWILDAHLEWDEGSILYPGTEVDVTCYVQEIIRSSSIGEATTATIRLIERDLIPNPEEPSQLMGMLVDILHNRVGQVVNIKDQDGRWFFRGYVESVNEDITANDRSGYFRTYELHCVDRTKLLTDYYNTFGNKTWNITGAYGVSDQYISDVFEDVLYAVGLDDISIDITDRPLPLALQEDQRITWKPGVSAKEFLDDFAQRASGMFYQMLFDWDGTFILREVQMLPEAVAEIDEAHTFYVNFEDACALDSNNWLMEVNEETTDTDFANVVLMVGSNPNPPPKYMNVVWVNYDSIYDTDSEVFVGRPIVKGQIVERVNDVSWLVYGARLLAMMWGNSFGRTLNFKSAYNASIKVGDGITLDGPLDHTYDTESQWIINELEVVVNRTSPIMYFDAYAYSETGTTEAGHKFAAVANYKVTPMLMRIIS